MIDSSKALAAMQEHLAHVSPEEFRKHAERATREDECMPVREIREAQLIEVSLTPETTVDPDGTLRGLGLGLSLPVSADVSDDAVIPTAQLFFPKSPDMSPLPPLSPRVVRFMQWAYQRACRDARRRHDVYEDARRQASAAEDAWLEARAKCDDLARYLTRTGTPLAPEAAEAPDAL